jgi:hypothetical protein
MRLSCAFVSDLYYLFFSFSLRLRSLLSNICLNDYSEYFLAIVDVGTPHIAEDSLTFEHNC